MGVDYTMHGTDARTAERHVASDCLAMSERPDSRAPPRGTGMGKPTRRDGRDGRDSPGGRSTGHGKAAVPAGGNLHP